MSQHAFHTDLAAEVGEVDRVPRITVGGRWLDDRRLRSDDMVEVEVTVFLSGDSPFYGLRPLLFSPVPPAWPAL